VHPTRASLRWVNYKDRKRVASQLKLIHGVPTEQAARDALDAWTDSEVGRQLNRPGSDGGSQSWKG
jgi:putative transposase